MINVAGESDTYSRRGQRLHVKVGSGAHSAFH